MRKAEIFISVMAIFLMVFTPAVYAEDAPVIHAESAILCEAVSGYVLYEKNAEERLPMASTTKLMTALLVRENAAPEDILTVSETAAKTEGSSAYFHAGEKMSIEQALYALLLSSGNDAAVALAEHIAGNTAVFADQMNEKAVQLGLADTHFANPSGLPDEAHYTTARELSVIARRVYRDDLLRKIMATQSYTFHSLDGTAHFYSNHNALLKTCPGVDGMKTGFTKAAGRCLVSSAQREGMSLICVTLKDPDDWQDHKMLFDYGFSCLCPVCIAEAGEIKVQIPITGSEVLCEAKNGRQVWIVEPLDGMSLTMEIENPKEVFLPIRKGQIVAYAVWRYEGTEVARCELASVADINPMEKNIPGWGIWERFFNFLLL